jgi:hypothetical protein
MMNMVLCGLTGSHCFVFLVDIVIYARSLSEYYAKLREVFGKFRKFNLKLQPGKCEFLRTEVSYLGHVITEKGVLLYTPIYIHTHLYMYIGILYIYIHI